MRLKPFPALALAITFACASPKIATESPAGAHPTRVVGYLASWGVGSKGTRVADLPAKDLTHIFYAFAKIGNDGRVVLFNPCTDAGACDSARTAAAGGNFDELALLKARNPHLKLAISIGGWTDSGKFSDAALTDSSRQLFTESALDLFIRQRRGLFDGIDIDWEFPVEGGMEGNVERPVDKENFTLLLSELRRELDAQGAIDHRHYELTIAASARPQEIANVEIARIEPLLDFINVMTYDYHSGPGRTNFNAPLYAAKGDPTPSLNVDVTMRAFLDAGVPASKLLVGVPFYGHAYGSVPSVNGGLFQQGTGKPDGWHENDGNWKVLAQTRLKDSRYVRHWESAARVPWLYDSTSGTWVSYDDPQSVGEKVRYVRDHGLGGVVIWELGGDDGSLMRAISAPPLGASNSKPDFRVIAFFTGKADQAHLSFLREAERWFPETAAKYNFSYDTTSNWNNLNSDFLFKYQVVVFLDTRPEDPAARAAFQAYMERGGAWMGFHFAGFALTPSKYPANWDWYHNKFIGAGSYVSNTWRPVSAVLRVEDRKHPATQHLPETFKSSPSEWYRWEKDLRQNPDIDILLSIDPTSFPLGTGPKLHEIWHSGYYPVVWTNRKYRMIYLNMGHNDIDYEHKYDSTNRTLSHTLNNPIQDQLVIDGLLWLGHRDGKAPVR